MFHLLSIHFFNKIRKKEFCFFEPNFSYTSEYINCISIQLLEKLFIEKNSKAYIGQFDILYPKLSPPLSEIPKIVVPKAYNYK